MKKNQRPQLPEAEQQNLQEVVPTHEQLSSHEEPESAPVPHELIVQEQPPRERDASAYELNESQPPAPASSSRPRHSSRHDGYRERDYGRDRERTNGGQHRSSSSRDYDNRRPDRPSERSDSSRRNASEAQQQPQPQIPIEEQTLGDLNIYARRLGIIGATLMNKPDLIKAIRHVEANPDLEMKVEGVLEKLPDGFGFLRSSRFDYVSGPDDVYVSPSQIRRFNLRTGDTVTGVIRKPKDGEKYFALLKVDKVNFRDPLLSADRLNFDRLTPLYPEKKFDIEYNPTVISTRIMDIFTPLGHGQRGLLVAPPKVGKTVLLKELAQAFVANHPDTYLIVLLIDERPEEVADMRRTVKGAFAEVISSTFDESAARHVQVAEIVLEKAKRLVEVGHHVIILLDSITRLARAYNTVAPASGKVLTGGIDANALQRPKRFFGAARNTEESGSLTIIASALVDTGSRMDEVIYEEFKGTGNMEMHMTRKLSSRRTYPAFDLMNSGTRRDDLLLSEEDLKKVWVLQKLLSTMNTVEGMEFLIDKMRKTKLNREFLDSINKKIAPDNGS